MRKRKILNKIKALEEKYENQQNVLNFLIEYGKDKVAIQKSYSWWSGDYTKAVYLYNKEIKQCELKNNCDYEVLKNENDEIILKETHLIKFSFCEDYVGYCKIDKATATYMQIPEPLFVSKEKEKETKAKKKV